MDDAAKKAREQVEQRRASGEQGKSSKGAPKNLPEQATHDASAHGQVHEENQDRVTDDLYDTEADNEVTEWKRHSDLEAPKSRPGYVNRFIRIRLGTARDSQRYRNAYREGWRPVKASAVSDRSLPTTHLEGSGEVIGVEDLILCEMPEEIARQRARHYSGKLNRQNSAIERQLEEVSQGGGDTAGFGPIRQTRRSRVSQRPPGVDVAPDD